MPKLHFKLAINATQMTVHRGYFDELNNPDENFGFTDGEKVELKSEMNKLNAYEALKLIFSKSSGYN